ncbi:MAG: zinc-binding dehydrogenase [Myxococcales bacterium]|nr:zinc-binding dehydrogenase [Myxococcales bacterium]MCB9732554.1 zinc-binding dehydrogenase [Deltaproteobacteria bacterium]
MVATATNDNAKKTAKSAKRAATGAKTAPAEVRKVLIRRGGSYDKLEQVSEPPKAPAAGQVAIDVRAIGVNYADVMVRMGLYSSAKEFIGWPITPGFEVSGVVSAIGDGVDDLAVGDEVIAVTLFGGYTSHLVVDAQYVFPKPKGVSFEAAAGVPAVMLTAWYAVHELAHPRPGAAVLVHSAAGGVGGSLVQILKRAGCKVVGVVGGSHKVETARALGADVVIDKSKVGKGLWREAERHAPDGYDVIFDANGVATLKDSYAHVRKAGKLVVYGFHTMIPKEGGRPNWVKLAADFLRTPRFSPLEMTQSSKSVLAFNLSYLFDRTELFRPAVAELTGWLEDGTLQAPPTTVYPLADVARAHRDIESGKTVGKLILVP